MGTLSIRCFGGLEAWRGDQPVDGFESRKVRALLAYLVCNRQRAFSREHLAGLFWPEKIESDARRNLRQALYNLRNVLAEPSTSGSDPVPIFTNKGGIRLAPELSCWVDVEAFDEATQQLPGESKSNAHELAGAVRLYRGDFLADISLPESVEFESWLDTERDRLREGLEGALRTLVESYMLRGEFRLGIQFAQRLVSMDPLSEEAHRYLIRLFALSGRRRRALDQYRNLAEVLRTELDVEPLDETQRLYQTILAERTPLPLANEEREPIGPLVPLVGRTKAFGQLTRVWQSMLRGSPRLTIVEGEVGIGKTRLVRSFLDAASDSREVTILTGRCSDIIPRVYQPIPTALADSLEDDLIARLPKRPVGLSSLFPDLAEPGRAENQVLPASREQLFDGVADLFEALMHPPGGRRGVARPLALFLDDLHSSTEETLDLLAYVIGRLAGQPFWVVATARLGSSVRRDLEKALALRGAVAEINGLELERLDRNAMAEIAAWLVRPEDAAILEGLLVKFSGGLPFHIAELVNFLWDQDALIAAEGGRWRLVDRMPEAVGVGNLSRMLGRRLARLPFSTRRLATLAAVIGQDFEPELIRRTADEHPTVVEVGLEIMLERWILRQNADRWTTSGRQRDIVLWSHGARQGSFDFSHKRTREVIYRSVSDGRRRLIHGQVADALEALHGGDPDEASGLLAFHFEQAGEWDRAARYAKKAADRARSVFACGVADHFDAMCKRVGESARIDPMASRRVEPETGSFAVP